jgi:NADH:ubiquinone oxidoreductase subunit F (NADH-binding)
MLERVLDGKAAGNEFGVIPELDETLRLTSICGLGQVALNPLTSVMKHFPDEIAKAR